MSEEMNQPQPSIADALQLLNLPADLQQQVDEIEDNVRRGAPKPQGFMIGQADGCRLVGQEPKMFAFIAKKAEHADGCGCPPPLHNPALMLASALQHLGQICQQQCPQSTIGKPCERGFYFMDGTEYSVWEFPIAPLSEKQQAKQRKKGLEAVQKHLSKLKKQVKKRQQQQNPPTGIAALGGMTLSQLLPNPQDPEVQAQMRCFKEVAKNLSRQPGDEAHGSKDPTGEGAVADLPDPTATGVAGDGGEPDGPPAE